MENPLDVQSILNALTDTSAKRRERTIQALTPDEVRDPRIQDRLQRIVSADPVEYARNAARAALIANGITPMPSATEIQLREEEAQKPALFAFGLVGLVIACLILACIAIAVVAIVSGGSWSF